VGKWNKSKDLRGKTKGERRKERGRNGIERKKENRRIETGKLRESAVKIVHGKRFIKPLMMILLLCLSLIVFDTLMMILFSPVLFLSMFYLQ
jgi:hypothetical protein